MVAPILYVMSTFRKLLLSLLLVSLTGSAFGAGTFASFTASTTNASSTFASGTVILENTRAGGSGTCFSTAAGFDGGTSTDVNANTACDNLFAFTTAKPGDSVFADLTLKNGGDVAASTIEGIVSACTASKVGTYSGSIEGRICAATSGLQIQVQEHSTNAFNTPVAKCIYPIKAAAACGTDHGFLGGFIDQTYGNASFVSAGLANGESKFLKITVLFPNEGSAPAVTDNMLMGLQAAFSITWNIAQ